MEIVLFVVFPFLVLLICIAGLLWATRRRNKGFAIGYGISIIGVLVHFIGLIVIRGFEGLGVSMAGTGIIIVGLLLLIIMAVRYAREKKGPKRPVNS